ncbi:MAG: hypothetical protein EOP45_17860 [Sphingobacteriaceae bacterium]|nr:MAG: hypothetical protein EOP45_17860 [Sphingobacteriaceae bacterium]
MDRSFFIILALSLCLLVLFFAPTVIAFIKFVHCYNHKGFFDAVEFDMHNEEKLDATAIEEKISEIIDHEKNKAEPLRFYDYIHALDQYPMVEEYTKIETKFRQYDYWLYHVHK